MSKLLYTYENPCSLRDLARASEVLAKDGILAYPTDVNWAFGIDPRNAKALDRIRWLKPSHPKEQPFTLLCSDIAMIAEYAYIEGFVYKLLRKILPGPYTIILPRSKNLPKALKDNRKMVGIRIPKRELLLELIRTYQAPIATTSVPQDEKHPIEYGYQVEAEFGHGLDLILDLGAQCPPLLTTILDCSEGEIKVVRQGIGAVDFL